MIIYEEKLTPLNELKVREEKRREEKWRECQHTQQVKRVEQCDDEGNVNERVQMSS